MLKDQHQSVSEAGKQENSFDQARRRHDRLACGQIDGLRSAAYDCDMLEF